MMSLKINSMYYPKAHYVVPLAEIHFFLNLSTEHWLSTHPNHDTFPMLIDLS